MSHIEFEAGRQKQYCGCMGQDFGGENEKNEYITTDISQAYGDVHT